MLVSFVADLRQVGIPTEAGLPHAFGNAFRNVAALVSDIDFTFKEATVSVAPKLGWFK